MAGVPANPTPAKVLNMSLGSTGSCSAAYQEAVNELTARGVVVVVAAGNEGKAVDAPANCTGAVGVAGVRHTGTKVGYSSLGPQVAIAAPAGNCVNDPGLCLYPLLTTTNTGTTTPVSSTYTDGVDQTSASLGTSFSAPLVAGTAALMLSINPQTAPAQIIAKLKSTARAFPTTGADAGVVACQAPSATDQLECYCTTATCGAGLLNAAAAVAAVNAVSAVIGAPSSAPAAGTPFTVSGAGSTVGAGLTVKSYQWAITSGPTVAAISGSATSAAVTVNPLAAGNFTLQLTVTDSLGKSAIATSTITVSAANGGGGGSSGGGALSPVWALGLLAAIWGLRRQPSSAAGARG